MGRRAFRIDATGKGDLEVRLDRLACELLDVRSRLEALERHAGLSASAPAPAASTSTTMRPSEELAAASLLALVGRSLVALGAAFLLRVATDAGMVPSGLGIGAGLGYAALFLVLADREAGRNRRASATCHAITAAAITHPLLFEATARFDLLQPAAAGALLVVFLAAGWIVALRRGLAIVASVVSLTTLVAALALLQQARDLAAFAAPLFVLAGIVEAAGLRGLWPGLRWPGALGVDLTAWIVAEVVARPGGMPESWTQLRAETATALLLLLPLLYLSTDFARLIRGSGPAPFDVVQTVIILPLGLGGAVRVLESAGQEPLAVGILATLLGACGYASLAVLRARPAASLFAGAVAFALVLAGTFIAMPVAARVAAWSLMAVVTAAALGRAEATHLEWHASAYLLAAASASGLLPSALAAFVARTGPVMRAWPGIPGALAALAAVACHGTLVARGGRRAHLGVRTLAAAVFGAAVGALAVRSVLTALGATMDLGVVAAVRTLVLAGLALLLAASSRASKLPELSLLSYLVLGLGGLKFLVEDLPSGSPATLFLALTAYGGALLAVSRIARADAETARLPGS